jgi:16S rRNA A1518/A1519 N6-dimethyltransferase RsmA/KsgA/DIM1 with predicted DNA glycosylase/AP lyase activity
MSWLIIAISLLVLLFGFVIAFGAPYLPTMQKQVDTAFDLLDLKPGQTLIELGCGDGRVLAAAAGRGLNAVGYELNPVLVVVSRLRTLRYGKKAKVIWGDYWHEEWPKADGIFVFLLDRYMVRLDKKIIQWKRGHVKLVSYAFKVPHKKPVMQKNGLILYKY